VDCGQQVVGTGVPDFYAQIMRIAKCNAKCNTKCNSS